MYKRFYWGVGALIIIICTPLGVMILYNLNVTQQLKEDANDTEKLLQDNINLKNETGTKQTENIQRPPPSGETHETGYWHEDHWHRTQKDDKTTPNTQQGLNATHLKQAPDLIGQSRSPEEIERYRKKWGVDPPPIGAKWQHLRNHTGEVIRHYNNSITVLYKIGTGFAPTSEQWEQHEALQEELVEAEHRGDTAEYNRILGELKTLIENSQGPVPIINGGVYTGDPISNEEKHRRVLEAERDLYRKFGLIHQPK